MQPPWSRSKHRQDRNPPPPLQEAACSREPHEAAICQWSASACTADTTGRLDRIGSHRRAKEAAGGSIAGNYKVWVVCWRSLT